MCNYASICHKAFGKSHLPISLKNHQVGMTFWRFPRGLMRKSRNFAKLWCWFVSKKTIRAHSSPKSVKSVKFSLNGSKIKTLQNQNLNFNICKNPITEVKHCVGTKITLNSSSTNAN